MTSKQVKLKLKPSIPNTDKNKEVLKIWVRKYIKTKYSQQTVGRESMNASTQKITDIFCKKNFNFRISSKKAGLKAF